MKKFVNEIMSLPSLIKRSAQGFKKVNVLVGLALLISLNIIIGEFKIVLIPKTLEIGFSTITYAISGFLYGPFMTGISGIICDNLKYILNPSGAYMPLFSLNEFLTGFIYGCFFYKKEHISILRIIVARLLVVLLINLVLTPLWLHILYGNSFFVLVQARLLTNLCKFPFDIFILYTLLTATKRAIPKHIISKS